MRVALIQPRLWGFRGAGGIRGIMEPLSLCYLAAQLEGSGHTTHLLHVLDESDKDILNWLLLFKPDLVGITSFTHNFQEGVRIAQLVKRTIGDIPVVYGGPHVSVMPQVVCAFPEIDYVVIGEGEQTFNELVASVSNGSSIKGINGIAYNKNNSLVITSARERITDLDSLLIPKRSDLPMHRYRQVVPLEIPPSSQRFASIHTARGCRFHCTFCQTPQTWGGFIARSAKNVLVELEKLVNEYGVNYIWIADEDFFADPIRAEEIFQLSCERHLGLIFRSFIGIADVLHLGPSLLKRLRKLGLAGVIMGIESLSDKVLGQIKKPYRGDRIEKALTILDEANIHVRATYMIGYPWESEEELLSNLDKLLNLPGLDEIYLPFMTPFPGTPFGDYCMKENLLYTTDFNQYDCSIPIVRTSIPRERLIEIQSEFVREYYMHPKTLTRVNNHIKKHPALAKSYKEIYQLLFKLIPLEVCI